MSPLGALGGQLVLFALSLVLMQAGLRWSRATGLFAALPWGLLPAFLMAGLAFWQIQQRTVPDVVEARNAYMAKVDAMAAEAYPKPDDIAERDDMRQLLGNVFEVLPAAQFGFHMAILAAMAVVLRRRYAKVGLLPDAEPLSEWTAPWHLAWLVLGPAFLLVGRAQGLFDLVAPWPNMAWNILLVGLVIFLFQGMVVAAAKLRSWWVDPKTRALVFLGLAAIFASLLIQSGRGLIAFLLLTGLFEPWVDMRRLRQPPPEPPA